MRVMALIAVAWGVGAGALALVPAWLTQGVVMAMQAWSSGDLSGATVSAAIAVMVAIAGSKAALLAAQVRALHRAAGAP